MTLRQFYNAVEGYRKEKEEDLKWDLYHARLISFYTVFPHLKKGKIKKPSDLFKMDFDDELEKVNHKRKVKKLKPIQVIKKDDQQPNS